MILQLKIQCLFLFRVSDCPLLDGALLFHMCVGLRLHSLSPEGWTAGLWVLFSMQSISSDLSGVEEYNNSRNTTTERVLNFLTPTSLIQFPHPYLLALPSILLLLCPLHPGCSCSITPRTISLVPSKVIWSAQTVPALGHLLSSTKFGTTACVISG